MIYYHHNNYMPKYNSIEYPVDQIQDWIESQGKTQQWIADKLQVTLDPRVTAKLIYKVCKKHQIKCQRTGPRSGEGHPEWKGGRILNKDGYIEVYSPDSPMRRKRTPYVLEHRLVVSKSLGRPLTRQEVVHHIDGNKQNNAIENLELFQNNAEHLRVTLKGKCPQWTPEGYLRMKEAASSKHQAALERQEMLRQLSDGMNQKKEPCECWSSESLRRRLIDSSISLEQAYEMGPELLIQEVGR
tara:strand:+ start:392 stop:1117 length:726 start_codon:yes stop_codon:yes gene_type:complete